MRKIVRACAGRASIRTNSVCKELGPAGAIRKLVAGVRDNARSCVMRVSIRTSSVWKELGHVGATTQPADKAYAFHLNAERQAANVELRGYQEKRLSSEAVERRVITVLRVLPQTKTPRRTSGRGVSRATRGGQPPARLTRRTRRAGVVRDRTQGSQDIGP